MELNELAFRKISTLKADLKEFPLRFTSKKVSIYQPVANPSFFESEREVGKHDVDHYLIYLLLNLTTGIQPLHDSGNPTENFYKNTFNLLGEVGAAVISNLFRGEVKEVEVNNQKYLFIGRSFGWNRPFESAPIREGFAFDYQHGKGISKMARLTEWFTRFACDLLPRYNKPELTKFLIENNLTHYYNNGNLDESVHNGVNTNFKSDAIRFAMRFYYLGIIPQMTPNFKLLSDFFSLREDMGFPTLILNQSDVFERIENLILSESLFESDQGYFIPYESESVIVQFWILREQCAKFTDLSIEESEPTPLISSKDHNLLKIEFETEKRKLEENVYFQNLIREISKLKIQLEKNEKWLIYLIDIENRHNKYSQSIKPRIESLSKTIELTQESLAKLESEYYEICEKYHNLGIKLANSSIKVVKFKNSI